MNLSAKSVALVLVLAATAGLVGVGCGGDDDGGTNTAATQQATDGDPVDAGKVKVNAAKNGDLRFVPESLTAKPGQLTFVFVNEAPIRHTICLEDPAGKLVAPDPICRQPVIGGATFLAEVEPGQYTYYCDVDGHREQGMQGTLTVE